MQPQLPLRESERENWDFFLSIPELDRNRFQPIASGHAGGTAAFRVLRRVRRLRRNAIYQIAHTIVRRSIAHCQCDRLLLDLRRQPADHSLSSRLRRPRTGLGEFLIRRQRRVWAWFPCFARQAARIRRRIASLSFTSGWPASRDGNSQRAAT